MTQQELASAVGCSRQTIVVLEQERYSPSLTLAMRIARVFGVTVDELFRLETDPAEESGSGWSRRSRG